MMKKIFVFRLAILLLTVSVLVSCGEGRHQDHAAAGQEVYTCPMHPEIIRNGPGACPICGMDLVIQESGSGAVGDVELETLLKPTNAFVVASVPVTTLQQREEDLEFDVVGTVAYDTRQLGTISSRVSGRIERLYLRYKYQPVKKGQRVMEIYSPELATAQQNLLFLLRNDPGNQALIDAARDRLVLMGMSPAQVAAVIRTGKPDYTVTVFSNYGGFVSDLNNNTSPGNNMQPAANTGQLLAMKEGMYVQAGQSIFSVYDPDRAWILLDLFPEQQDLVRTGDAVRVVPETAPQKNFRATIDYIEPVFRPEDKTRKARIYFNNASLQLPIGSRVTATIFSDTKNAYWLPREAVLSLGRDRIVFTKEAAGFRAHEVRTGLELNRFIEITGGLSAGDSVAANAQFLVDNEAFIKVNER